MQFEEPATWAHIVLNYIGPQDGEGIRVYKDGALAARDDSKYHIDCEVGNGVVVLRRQFKHRNEQHRSLDVDFDVACKLSACICRSK